jgi:hypothetical protein
LKIDWSGRYRGLERLNEAGFIEVRASKAASSRASNLAGTDKEGSYEPKKKSVASSARRNGAARKRQQRIAVAVSTATSWLEDEPAHLVHRSVREEWPDMADTIISQLGKGRNSENGPEPEKADTQEPISGVGADPLDQPLAEISDDDIPF